MLRKLCLGEPNTSGVSHLPDCVQACGDTFSWLCAVASSSGTYGFPGASKTRVWRGTVSHSPEVRRAQAAQYKNKLYYFSISFKISFGYLSIWSWGYLNLVFKREMRLCYKALLADHCSDISQCLQADAVKLSNTSMSRKKQNSARGNVD